MFQLPAVAHDAVGEGVAVARVGVEVDYRAVLQLARADGDFGDGLPVFVGEEGPVIGAVYVDLHILRQDKIPVLDVERAFPVGVALHEGFVGGVIDADLEILKQLFALALVEGVEVLGFLRTRLRWDEGVDDFVSAVFAFDGFGVQGSVGGFQVSHVELVAHDEPGDKLTRRRLVSAYRIDLLDRERAEFVAVGGVSKRICLLILALDVERTGYVLIPNHTGLGELDHVCVRGIAHKDRGVGVALHDEGDMLLRPRAMLVTYEDGEFILVLRAKDKAVVGRRVRIFAGLRVDGEHAVLALNFRMCRAHAGVVGFTGFAGFIVKGFLKIRDVGAVRVADMPSGNAIGQRGAGVHIRPVGLADEGVAVFVHFDLGFFSYRLPVICRLLNDRDAVIAAV